MRRSTSASAGLAWTLFAALFASAAWAGQHDAHAAHRAAMSAPGYSVSAAQYEVPDVTLLDTSGNAIALREVLDSGQPVALNFIFTTCTTICPVMTATFSQMRRELGDAADQVLLVSISIDPEYDRPAVLGEYASMFGADAGWTFLTGDGADIIRVLQSFNAYAGSKMNHQPVTLLKSPDSSAWVRIDGLVGGQTLASEVSTRLLQ